MIRFSFSFDEILPELVTESTAFYRVDGTLRLDSDKGLVFEEPGAPLVELAVWLLHWLGSNKQTHSFLPDGYDEDYGPMLNLEPAGSNQYRLSYNYGATPTSLAAELDEWETVFTQYLDDLREAILTLYNLQLDVVLHRFRS